jgi:hypothetical protein
VFLGQRCQIHLHLLQCLVGDDDREESVERLFGAAVGIIGQVGKRVDHRGRQAWGDAHHQPRLIRSTFLGDIQRHLALALLASQSTGETVGHQESSHQDRQR